MATRAEIHEQLRVQIKTIGDLSALMVKIGFPGVYESNGWTTLDQKLEANFEEILNKADKDPKCNVKVHRILKLSTPDDKFLELAEESNRIAHESNIIALRARKDARISMLAAIAAVVVAFFPLVVSAVTRWIGTNVK